MKIIILILLNTYIYANSILVLNAKGSEGKKTFLKIEGDACYYKNGYKSPNNCYIQTGNILIKFESPKTSELFLKYNLIYLKDVNSQNFTKLYNVSNLTIDLIELVNIINEENTSLTARVEWIRPRKLR